MLSFSFFGCISQVVKMPTVEFSVKRKQKLESKKKQEEVNMLEGALSHNVIVKCGSTVEIISRIVELLQAVCLRARRRWCGKNKTALQTFSINEYLFAASISVKRTWASSEMFSTDTTLHFLFSVSQEIMLFNYIPCRKVRTEVACILNTKESFLIVSCFFLLCERNCLAADLCFAASCRSRAYLLQVE